MSRVAELIAEAEMQMDNERRAADAARVRRIAVFAPFAAGVRELRALGAEYYDWKAGRYRPFREPSEERLVMPFGIRGAIKNGRRDNCPWLFEATDPGEIRCFDPHHRDCEMAITFTSGDAALAWLMGMGSPVSRGWSGHFRETLLPSAQLRISGKVFQHGRVRD